MYQGAAVSIASRLGTDPDQRPEGFDFFGYDLDSRRVRSGSSAVRILCHRPAVDARQARFGV